MRPTIAAAVATFALLTLTGCSHTDDPPASADPAPTVARTSTSPHPGPTEPTMPPAAQQQTKAGAIAFAKYYWTVVDYAQKSGDTSRLKTLATPRCRACAAGTRWLDRIFSRNGSVIGGERSVIRSWVPMSPQAGASDYLVVLRLRTTRQTISHAGALNKHYAGGTELVNMSVRHYGTDWKVDSWDLQQ